MISSPRGVLRPGIPKSRKTGGLVMSLVGHGRVKSLRKNQLSPTLRSAFSWIPNILMYL